jgi:cysteinyl-tRNA synthetase
MAFELFGLGALAEEDTAPPEVVELAGQREAARAARDFGESDRLRGEIESLGWEVRDEAAGFRLVRKQ